MEIRMPLFYLSFCDGARPKGKQWLGGLYVSAVNTVDAVCKSWDLKQNPGGQVLSIELPDDAPVKLNYRDRLLTEEEPRQAGPDSALQRMNGETF